jgi:hypothetical protein
MLLSIFNILASLVDLAALSVEVKVWEPEAFVNYDSYIDLKRFSRYWSKAQQYVYGG